MRWHQLIELSELDNIEKLSEEQHIRAVLVFKHSTRCSISNMALNRLETKWPERDDIPCYYLDLLNHRDISEQLALRYRVRHESPQVLLIKNKTCIYHESHNGISAHGILDALTK